MSTRMDEIFRQLDAGTDGSADLSFIEKPLYAVGLMTGPAAPLKRAVVGAGVAYGILHFTKPSFAYSKEGMARPWSVTNPSAANGTLVPWWTVMLGGAAFLGLFV